VLRILLVVLLCVGFSCPRGWLGRCGLCSQIEATPGKVLPPVPASSSGLAARTAREWEAACRMSLGEGGGRVAQPRFIAAPTHDFEPRVDAGHDIQHIGPAGRAEALLPRLEVGGAIGFEIRVITAQAVLANVV
jgi:hypothetical protein